MNEISGRCKCGNIELRGSIRDDSLEITPRVCGCNFCRQNKAVYLSDTQGSVEFRFKDKEKVKIHKQGSGLANFIICKSCGSFIGVTYDSGDEIFATLNLNLLNDLPPLQAPEASIPGNEAVDDKVKRWQHMWFKSVKLGGLT